ncbi:hypothetical protein NGM37_45480, partial [Streptomyces sp. TRM76130]|nr:hypothetical protein [Streptomyces sp. TRM76130]
MERARGAIPALHALLTEEPRLADVLRENPELAETLARRPQLLDWPHEYRRLLSSAGRGLIPYVREGSPLLAPHILRSALRHESVRRWLL